MVGWRSCRAEGCLQRCLDLLEMRILAIVGPEYCENQYRWKGKGFLAMQISQELVDPNRNCNSIIGKGKSVNIPILFSYVWQHKLGF